VAPVPFDPAVGRVNGQGAAGSPDEWQRIEQAYREIQRRDASAERRTWRAERLALAVLALLAVTLGVVVWQFTHAHTVQAFVQVVQVDEKGQLVQVGIPQDLLAYTPPDGLWMDMITQWVMATRWRGTDPVKAHADWGLAYRHTCGQARRLLQGIEERDKPFAVGKILRTVEMKSITKTPAPESYQALWMETSTSKQSPTVVTQQWTGTFTVGRMTPPTLADALHNRLGLCLTAFDISMQP